MYQYSSYSISLFVAAIIAVVMGLVTSRHKGKAARTLTLLQFSIFEWALGTVFESAATTIKLKFFWVTVSYIGTITAPILFYIFAVYFVDSKKILSKKLLTYLLTIAGLTMIFALTNDRFHLMWTGMTINPETNIAIYSHGAWYWIFIISSWTFMLLGAGYLLSSIRKLPLYYRKQIYLIIFGSMLPIAGNLFYLTQIGPAGIDWTPISFSLTGIILAVLIFRQHMFELMPVARHKLLEIMQDSIFVIDKNQVIIDINQAGQRLIAGKKGGLRRPLAEVFKKISPDVVRFAADETIKQTDIEIKQNNDVSYYNVKKSVLYDLNKQVLGLILVFRDVTTMVRLQQEKSQLNEKYQTASKKIQTLSGLLPICANCKKIRDDKGYWQNVDQYIADHSNAEFSQGLCPDCIKKLYPEVYQEMVKNGEISARTSIVRIPEAVLQRNPETDDSDTENVTD